MARATFPIVSRRCAATIQWSYDLLDDDERRAFDALGVFVAGFSLHAAERVLSGISEQDPLELVASLVDKSLLRADVHATEPRFRMLSMIAEFAREQLDESADRDRVRDQFAGFYREFSAAAGAGARGPEQREWLSLLERDGESQNVRGALEWLLGRAPPRRIRRDGMVAVGSGVDQRPRGRGPAASPTPPSPRRTRCRSSRARGS